MRLHELKTDPGPFKDVWSTRKTFEIRRDDRGFSHDDVLRLREHDRKHDRYSGREVLVLVQHLMRGPDYGIPAGYAVMSIKLLVRLPGKAGVA